MDHNTQPDQYEQSHGEQDADHARTLADENQPTPEGGEQPSTPEHEAGDGVLELIAQVDEQLKRIRHAQQTQDEGLNSLADRFHRLEESECTIKEEREALEAERSALAKQREDVERMQVEIGREREAMNNEQRECENRISEQHASLQQREEELTRRQDELNAELDRLREREQQLQEQGESLDREREELHRRVEEAESRLAEAETRMNELSQQLASVEAERDTSRERLAEQRRQLEMAGEKLREFADALNEQNTQLDHAASAMALVKQQERKIEELQQQLAEGTPDKHASSADGANELERELQEKNQQIESLNATIEQLRGELSGLAEQKAANPEASSVDDGRETEMQSLRERIKELERELTTAKEEAAAAHAAAEARANQPSADELHAKAKRVAQVATHVRRRRRRLKYVRELLRERAAGLPRQANHAGEDDPSANREAIHQQHEALMQQMQEIEQQREQVKETRAALAATERNMIRQWAKPRAVTVMLGVMALLAANIAAAWALTNHFVPAERTASITIEPRTSTGQTLEPEAVERWQQWHAEIVTDDAFMRTLAQRLGERRLDDFGDPAALKETFRDRLTIDRSPDGAITYTLAGQDAAKLTGALDVLASTIVIESDRQMRSRGDRAWAVARNERKEGGSLRYSLMNAWTLADDRHLWMLPFLGGTLLMTALAMWLIYTRLIRAKQLFEESVSVVQDSVT